MIGALLIALLQTTAPEVGATPAPATPPPPVVQPAPPPAPAARPNFREELHCHNEAVTGSRLGRKVCRSRADEDRIADDSRKTLENLQGARLPSSN